MTVKSIQPEFAPTTEQLAIVDFARGDSRNMLVQALAGAAKTSTLELIAAACRGYPVLAIAFNKRIAEEMASRLPSHCICKTLNSVGHTAWGAHIGKRLVLNARKIGDILKELDLSRGEREELRDLFGDVVQLASRAKLYGYIPEDRYEEVFHLTDRAALEEVLADAEYPALAWALLDRILCRSIDMAFKAVIDFDDQIYMPTLFGASLPKFRLNLVDEAQDLSPLNHQMIAKLVGDRRLIAVGDAYQSIYGFRGAVSDGMSVLQQRFAMQEFRLSISFRCPKEVIKLARKRAPYMQWAENAPEGEVRYWDRKTEIGGMGVETEVDPTWGPGDIPNFSAVICRNNAPLFSLGLKLLAAGRGVTIRGFDLSKRLIKILEELGHPALTRTETVLAIEDWKTARLREGKLSEATIEDRYTCLMVFAQATNSLGEAISHAKALFAAEGPIELLSGHKSKGLEWNDVFHLDPWRIPSAFARSREEIDQERNIEYVITTRAKRTLTLLNIEDYDPEASNV